MVSFRTYKNLDDLFKNLVVIKDKDWTSQKSTIFFGRYMREKSTGSLYRIKIIYPHHNFKTSRYYVRESLPGHFPIKLSSQGLKGVYSHSSFLNITLDIIFRNKEDYLRAEKELNICQTYILEIPFLLSKLGSIISKVYERFEDPRENKEEIFYLYKPSN